MGSTQASCRTSTERPVPSARAGHLLRRAAWVAATLLVVLILVRALVVTPVTVQGESMEPTFGDGDVAVVINQLWGAPDPERGDVVVFRDADGSLSLKRVIGLPGDRVAILDAILEVDGRVVPENYVDHSLIDGLYFGPVTVPAGAVFLLGDNRADSVDSRTYGPVELDRIVGWVVAGS